MKKYYILLIALLSLALSYNASAEVWNVTIDASYGTWTKDSGVSPGPFYFNESMNVNGHLAYSARMKMFIVNNEIMASDLRSDNSTCQYDGTINDAKTYAFGTVSCGPQGKEQVSASIWYAYITP
jgi:hypothetical protein